MSDEFNKGARFIFVGGLARSGTTLVQRMLIEHPEICGGPEFHKLLDIMELRKRMHMAFERGMIQHFCNKEDIDREIGLMVERLFRPFIEKSGKRLFSEKTPWNVLVFDELLEVFTEARCVFCIRDPRAAISSLFEVGAKESKIGTSKSAFTMSLSGAISKAKESFDAGFQALEHCPERVAMIRYEDAVAEPEKETKRLCEFLGIEWSASMVELENKKQGMEQYVDGGWYDSEKLFRGVDNTSLEKWRSKLKLSHQYIISKEFARDERLKQIGYRFDDVKPNLLARLQYGLWLTFRGMKILVTDSERLSRRLLKRIGFIRRMVYALRS